MDGWVRRYPVYGRGATSALQRSRILARARILLADGTVAYEIRVLWPRLPEGEASSAAGTAQAGMALVLLDIGNALAPGFSRVATGWLKVEGGIASRRIADLDPLAPLIGVDTLVFDLRRGRVVCHDWAEAQFAGLWRTRGSRSGCVSQVATAPASWRHGVI